VAVFKPRSRVNIFEYNKIRGGKSATCSGDAGKSFVAAGLNERKYRQID
jgi:hypothetical protein